jgi:hypothetical protein
MRRFERVQAGVPDRAGVNPFTRQLIVIRGRPEITSRCDLEIDGTDVIRSWSWVHAGERNAAPCCSRQHFDDRASAENHAAEYIEDLLCDGFRELGSPAAGVTEPRERLAQVPSPAARQLPRAIVEHCRKRGWFGDDMVARTPKGTRACRALASSALAGRRIRAAERRPFTSSLAEPFVPRVVSAVRIKRSFEMRPIESVNGEFANDRIGT